MTGSQKASRDCSFFVLIALWLYREDYVHAKGIDRELVLGGAGCAIVIVSSWGRLIRRRCWRDGLALLVLLNHVDEIGRAHV